MEPLSRQEKIDLLKGIQSGIIPVKHLPEQPSDASVWHYNGKEYIKLHPQLHTPHKSGIVLSPDDFGMFVFRNCEKIHTVYDSVGIDPGNMQLERVTLGDSENSAPTKPNIMRVGVVLPLGRIIPVKATQWNKYFEGK